MICYLNTDVLSSMEHNILSVYYAFKEVFAKAVWTLCCSAEEK